MATAIMDPITGWRSNAAIAIVDAKMLNEEARQSLTLESGGAQRDKVTLIAYPNVEKVGMLGEERVLTFFEGEFQRFELLGTKEANAALEEFERKGKRTRTDKVADDLFEEGDFEVG